MLFGAVAHEYNKLDEWIWRKKKLSPKDVAILATLVPCRDILLSKQDFLNTADELEKTLHQILLQRKHRFWQQYLEVKI